MMTRFVVLRDRLLTAHTLRWHYCMAGAWLFGLKWPKGTLITRSTLADNSSWPLPWQINGSQLDIVGSPIKSSSKKRQVEPGGVCEASKKGIKYREKSAVSWIKSDSKFCCVVLNMPV